MDAPVGCRFPAKTANDRGRPADQGDAVIETRIGSERPGSANGGGVPEGNHIFACLDGHTCGNPVRPFCWQRQIQEPMPTRRISLLTITRHERGHGAVGGSKKYI
jgi:hypothetical protein